MLEPEKSQRKFFKKLLEKLVKLIKIRGRAKREGKTGDNSKIGKVHKANKKYPALSDNFPHKIIVVALYSPHFPYLSLPLPFPSPKEFHDNR